MSLEITATKAQQRQAEALIENVNREALRSRDPGYRVRSLDHVVPERIQWLWTGHIPKGKSVVIDGDPGQGKSTITDDLVARITTGDPWPDGSPGCNPGNVILMSAEDGLADTILPRILAAGGDTSRVFALEGVADEKGVLQPPMLPGAIPRIKAAVIDHKATALVIDVLMSYLDGSVNSYKDQDIRAKVMTPLTAMLEETGCTAILLRHLNKNVGGNAISRGGGSIGIVGAARAAYVVASDRNDPDRHIMAPEKFNLGVMPKALAYVLADDPDHGCARVRWLGETDDTADRLLAAPPESEDEKEERNTVQAFLLDYLESKGGEAPASDVIKAGHAAGFEDSQIKHARQRCRDPRIDSRKSGGSGFGWVWAIEMEVKGTIKESTPPLFPSNTVPLAPLSNANETAMAPLTKETKGATARDNSTMAPLTDYPISGQPSQCMQMASNGYKSGTQAAVGPSISSQLLATRHEAGPASNTPASAETGPRPLDLARFDSNQFDGLAGSWSKQLQRDGIHSMDSTLARMTPESLEMLNRKGGMLKTATDAEYERRSRQPITAA